jgi:hypothetical protein
MGSNAIELTSLVRADSEVVESEFSGKKMLLEPKSGRYFALEGTALLVWGFLSADATVDVIVEGVVEKYSIDRTRAENDVLRFLTSLDRAGLLIVGN